MSTFSYHIDVPVTPEANNYQHHADDDDAETALTFGLAVSQIVAKDDDDADAAMSVSTMLTSSGIQTVCQPIAEISTEADGASTCVPIPAAPSSNGTRSRAPSANHVAADREPSTPSSRVRRGFGIMLADAAGGGSDATATSPTFANDEAGSCIDETGLPVSSASPSTESFAGNTTFDSSIPGSCQDSPGPAKKTAGPSKPALHANDEKSKPRVRCSSQCLLLAGLAILLIVGGILGIVLGTGIATKAPADGNAMSSTGGQEQLAMVPTPAPLTMSDEPTRASKKKNGSNARTSPTASPESVSPTTIDQVSDPDAYVPGHLTQMKLGVRLSNGLDIKVIANSKRTVKYNNGKSSDILFHENPDFGATFKMPNTAAAADNGGWVYLSNSKMEKVTKNGKVISSGGVGRLTFNRYGKVIGYDRILENTDRNSGGGTTPWNTFVSCEESEKSPPVGHCFQVDPFTGEMQKKSDTRTVLGGSDGGSFESFAHDLRDDMLPRFFVTEDQADGALRRFTPAKIDWDNPSSMLHDEKGSLDYLFLIPSNEEGRNGTYQWTDNKNKARKSAKLYYPNAEGIDVANGILYFVSKKDEDLFILDLDRGTYERKIVREEGIDVSPDQLVRLGGDDDIMYLTEDGGAEAGIHGRDAQGRYFTILESPIYKEETTGLAFSPNKKHMYLAYQKNGIIFDVWRKDGKKFDGGSLNVKYHHQ